MACYLQVVHCDFREMPPLFRPDGLAGPATLLEQRNDEGERGIEDVFSELNARVCALVVVLLLPLPYLGLELTKHKAAKREY